MNIAQVRNGDVIRLAPGHPACRIYRDRNRSKDTVEHLTVDGHTMVRFSTGTGPVTVPADLDVELVARHGDNRRLVSLTKAWYLGPIEVESVVVSRCAPVGMVFRVTDIEHGRDNRYHLALFDGGPVVYRDARVGDLILVRSPALEAIRRRNGIEGDAAVDGEQPTLFEASDAA